MKRQKQGLVSRQSNSVIVVSDVYGQRGGAYRVTSLLCRALAEMDLKVTCFATWVDADSVTGDEDFEIVRPRFNHGYRWDIPNRILAWQARRAIEATNPTAVFVVGLTKICGHLLSSRVADQLLVWELTNANADNKFVDKAAANSLSRCHKVISPAATIDNEIRSTYSYTGEIARLPFWIEDETVPSDPPPPEEFEADFLFLARREDDKGLRELIRAAGTLSKELSNLRVLIAGPGDATPYQTLADECGASGSISFCSLPSRQDAMQTLSRCRFLVLPSYHEGYPLSLLEAAQYSIPIIATDVGSIREVFGDCKGCCIIAPRDVESLAKAMNSRFIMETSDYIAARRAVHQRFTELSSEAAVRDRLRKTLFDDEKTDS